MIPRSSQRKKKKRKHHAAAAQDINQKTGEDLQTVHQQEAQTVDSNQPAHQHGPHEENTEQPAQQHAAKEEMSESNISDDTDELIDRVRKDKRRRRRSSSTSNSEQYHHRKIQKHFQALGAKRYRRISNRDWEWYHKRARLKSHCCPHDFSQWEHMRVC